MTKSQLGNPEIVECIKSLSECETLKDAVDIWHTLKGRYPELSALLSIDNIGNSIPKDKMDNLTHMKKNLIHLFSHDNVFLINDDILTKMSNEGSAKVDFDYTISFDTQIASHVNTLIRGEVFEGHDGVRVQNQTIRVLTDIIMSDINFDFVFYLFENTKLLKQPDQFYSGADKLNLWKSLGKKFRQNLVSLQFFRYIDTNTYKKHSRVQFETTMFKAVREAIDFCYTFYNQKNVSDMRFMQGLMKLHLIIMVRINLSSKKGAKAKLDEYFKTCSEILGLYCEREAILAHKYFENKIDMLNVIQKNINLSNLSDRLDNIAWDWTVFRVMEKYIPLSEQSSVEFTIPLFLTFDKNLISMSSFHKIKGAVFERNSGRVITFPEINSGRYFGEIKCDNGLQYFFNDDEDPIERRLKARKDMTTERLKQLIDSEFRQLSDLLLESSPT